MRETALVDEFDTGCKVPMRKARRFITSYRTLAENRELLMYFVLGIRHRDGSCPLRRSAPKGWCAGRDRLPGYLI